MVTNIYKCPVTKKRKDKHGKRDFFTTSLFHKALLLDLSLTGTHKNNKNYDLSCREKELVMLL